MGSGDENAENGRPGKLAKFSFRTNFSCTGVLNTYRICYIFYYFSLLSVNLYICHKMHFIETIG